MNAQYPHIACILASGLSSRFGEQNKLLAKINNKAIINYVAQTVCGAGFDRVYAIVSSDPALHTALSEFELDLIINHHPELGQSEAIKLAANTAITGGATSMTIILGDMPFITTDHLIRLQKEANNSDAVASHNGKNSSPPVLFQSKLFERLKNLTGDYGALAILKTLSDVEHVKARPELLRDIDTPQMLAEYS